MQTLSYGYKKPQTGDKGSVFFPALEDNIQLLNDHSHNGSNSARLTASSVTVVTGTVLAASWAAVAGQTGTYRQLITMPVGLSYDDYMVSFKDASGHILYLTTEKVSTSTYYVYINDNTKALTAVYSS